MLGCTYILRPDADKETKAMLARTLLPDLLQLGSAKGDRTRILVKNTHKAMKSLCKAL